MGNLVCPAEFDTGAVKNVMILSVPEGDDKPLKYPLMFQVSHCLPTHSWFCGVALLLAPTIAALLWNKGGWIMTWATLPKLYADGTLNGIAANGNANADPAMMTVVSVLALVTNVIALAYIIYAAKKEKINPYKNEVFTEFKYYKNAAARAEIPQK